MADYSIEYVNYLLNYIENNLAGGLDTGLLSSAGFVSHAKLYRDFYHVRIHAGVFLFIRNFFGKQQ